MDRFSQKVLTRFASGDIDRFVLVSLVSLCTVVEVTFFLSKFAVLALS